MTRDRAEGFARPIDPELSDALIAHCNLSGQDIERITEAMRTGRQSFGEAALQLDLATPDDIDAVSHWVQENRSDGQGGVIEAALRSAQGSRALTVRQGVARISSELVHAASADEERGEKIRALRTDMMLLNDSAPHGNVFALLSPGRGEGRSQLCAELAIAFAQLGRHTLLLDADLRHPRQHVLFNVENQWGLAQSLSLGEQPFLHKVEGLPELTLLTSGTIPPNPLELVSHRRFERLLSEMRRQYDFVVIDTPPVAQFADAIQIATVAQRVVVVSRNDSTSFAGMKDMLRRLTVTDSRILGAVINRF